MESRHAVADFLAKLPTSMPGMHDEAISLLAEFSQGESSYAPQSGTIQGILGDMYATFAKNLEESTDGEGTNNGSFENLSKANDNKIKDAERARDDKMEDKAESEAML